MALPDPLRGRGRLFLWPPSLPASRDLETLASRMDRRLDVFPEHGCVAVHLDEVCALELLDAMRKMMDIATLRTTRAVFKSGAEEPSLADFPRAETLHAFIAFARAKWLVDMIAGRRVRAWFQPIVSAAEPHRLFALEALARGLSADPQEQLVLPHRLISAARDAGMMTAFDRYVHDRALHDFRKPDPVGLFLNVTPRSLEDPAFELEHLVRTALGHRIRPERITLEIIECESIADMARVQDVLTEARSLGLGIALDDLGAGFSNLNLVHQLRPDIVKLDMALTRNVSNDPYKSVLAAKMLEATRGLGVRTVAEGVEHPNDLRWLRAHGVDYVQGYLIARPAPPRFAA